MSADDCGGAVLRLMTLVFVCCLCVWVVDSHAQSPPKRETKEARPSLGTVLRNVKPKTSAPGEPRTAPKPRAQPLPRASTPRAQPPHVPVKQLQKAWPLALSIDDAPTRMPALVLKGFLNMGVEGNSQRFAVLMNEVELELDFHFSSTMRLEVAFQLTKDIMTLDTSGGLALLDHILQKALMFFQLPKGFALWIGRTFAYQGWEALNTLDRTNISISFTNAATPNTLTGLALRWAGGSAKVETQFDLFLANRWDSNTNDVLQPSVGLFASLTWKIAPQFSLVLTATPSYGVEPSAVDGTVSPTPPVFSLSTNLALHFFESRWQVVADLMVANDPAAGKSWYAMMVLTHAMVTRFLGFTARYSRLHDYGKLLSLTGIENQEWALAAMLLPLQVTRSSTGWVSSLQGLRVLLEGRIDMVGNDSSTISGQVMLSVILPFQVIFQPMPRRHRP